jgi:nicotinamide riboside kinase
MDSMRLAVSGTHSVGKTTLIHELVKVLPYPIINEISSRYTLEQRKNPEIQKMMVKEQIEAENEKSSFIIDRCILDYLTYCTLEHYDGNYPLETYEYCITMTTEHMKTKPYDVIVFIDECNSLEDNGNRKMENSYQKSIYLMLLSLTRGISITGVIPVINIRGPTQLRVKQVMKGLRTHHLLEIM